MIVLRNVVGRWFRVPRVGAVTHGLIARARGGVCLGYFFVGPITEARLRPRHAALVALFGGMKLRNGGWPFMDPPVEVDARAFPVPLMTSSLAPGVVFVRTRDDDLRFVSEQVMARRPRGSIEDCMRSPQSVEVELRRIVRRNR